MSNAAKLYREQSALLPKNSPVPNRRVLVIDDEPAIGEGIRRILSSQAKSSAPRSSRSVKLVSPPDSRNSSSQLSEFEVVVVTTPQQALEAVNLSLRDHKPFAMGFFDVVLNADIDGIQLVKQVLDLDPRMFAVFVTAYQDRTVDTIGSFLGEDNCEKWDYINKPFSEGEILQKARSISSLWDLHRLKEWQEERLSDAHRMLLQNERQNAAATIARSVAHEFGNLLTHIVGNAELAMEKKTEPAMKDALEIILKASDTARDILKRFRSMHGSDGELELKPVDLWHAIDEALELVDFQFRKGYINVLKSRREFMPVMGHRHRLVQVFVNIFMNSMYAMRDGGSLLINVAQVEDGVEISIKDSGPGIPEDILPRVTEALFTTKGSEGSGLGLAICKEIIEIEHAGNLTIQNHFKGGAEVIIRLTQPDPKNKVGAE